MRTFIIDGKRVTVKEEDIKKYCFVGKCFDDSGGAYHCGIFVRHDGKLIDPDDLTTSFPENLYDKNGNVKETKSTEIFEFDCSFGIEYNNKLHLLKHIEEVKTNNF